MDINKTQFNISFILLNPGSTDIEAYLQQNNVAVNTIIYKGKKDIPKAILSAFKILRKNKIQVVHTHLMDANIVGLIAAKLAGIKKRIHTRHHSDFHHLYYAKTVKYDRLINSLSTNIIAISEVVKNILITKENVSPNKINLIHHGFKLENFENKNQTDIAELLKKYNPQNSHPVIGVISRYMELKGIQYIIPAFKKMLPQYPDALLILANAKGDYKDEIKILLETLPNKNFVEISFEPNIFSLYHLFDVFVHVPIAPEIEAFGQIYVEALAAGIPSVFTLAGVAHEFIVDKQNALVVPYKHADAIYHAIMQLLEDKDLVAELNKNGKIDVSKKFTFEKMLSSLEKLYE